MKSNHIIVSIIFVAILSLCTFASETKVIKHPNPEESLNSKWQWALQQLQNVDDGIWIGWSITRLMPENAYMGIFISGEDKFDTPTLEQIIYNRYVMHPEDESLSDAATKALTEMDKIHSNDDKIVEKEVALLFYFKSNPVKDGEPDKCHFSNISLYFDLKNKPLLWLGLTPQDESANFLVSKYDELSDSGIKENYMTAIGVHRESEVPIDFLTSIIKSDEDSEIRENAVFWLGEHDNESSVDFIVDVANNDHSNDVREKAVFALYLMDSKKTENGLIELAKNSKDRNVRKKAIFWLGQKASNKFADTLEEIVEDDEDTEMKNQAVFALSQLDNNEGIPSLIEIANNHPNNEVRKKAIFWLGESGDSRALEAIIDIIRGN